MSDMSVLHIQETDRAIVATIQCKVFDHESTEQFRAGGKALADRSPQLPLLLDMGQVEFMASMTLGVLIGLANQMKAGDRRLVLCGISPQVRKIFKTSGIEGLFEIRETVDSALA
jgi:anti-anti-sigma factor